MQKTTMLVPTTKNVSEKMSIREALEILKSNNVEFDITDDVVNGMYLSDSGEIVEEELVPVTGNVTSRQLATMFTQECILEFDNNSAKLVAQNGDIWAEFDRKVEFTMPDVESAVELQRKMAKFFGGASRIDKKVYAWATASDIAKMAM